MVLPEVKQSPAKAVVAMPINKPLTSVPSDMSCRHVYPKLYFLVVELMKDIKCYLVAYRWTWLIQCAVT